MPLEVEQKFRVAGHEAVREKLRSLGAEPLGVVDQRDTYFAHPSRDFRQTGEALRIRQSGQRRVVTYKGPKLDATVKTRQEIEFPVEVQLAELLPVLGFQRVADVSKQRERFAMSHNGMPIEIALDSVENVGTFVEVETIAEQQTLDDAQAAVVAVAQDLGLTELEPRSYIRMYLESENSPPLDGEG